MYRIIYLLLFTSVFCFSQEDIYKHGDIVLFNKGIAVYETINEDLFLDSEIEKIDTTSIEGKRKYVDFVDMKEMLLERALKYFTELTEKYPKSKLYFMALNNKADLEFELNDEDQAKKTLRILLESKADDKDLGGLGSGIMAEPYANYKNRACKRLAKLEYEKGNYTESIAYLNLTKKYPYQHFCGNAIINEELYTAELYAQNYFKMGDSKSALKSLLPNIFNNSYADNSSLVRLAVSVLQKELGKQKARELFNDAKKTLTFKAEKRAHYVEEYEFYSIQFMNTQIEVDMPLKVYGQLSEEARLIMLDQIERSLINKLLNE